MNTKTLGDGGIEFGLWAHFIQRNGSSQQGQTAEPFSISEVPGRYTRADPRPRRGLNEDSTIIYSLYMPIPPERHGKRGHFARQRLFIPVPGSKPRVVSLVSGASLIGRWREERRDADDGQCRNSSRRGSRSRFLGFRTCSTSRACRAPWVRARRSGKKKAEQFRDGLSSPLNVNNLTCVPDRGVLCLLRVKPS